MADLQNFFRTYYAPNNCTLYWSAPWMPTSIRTGAKYFGPNRREMRRRRCVPRARAARRARLVLERPGQNPLLHYAYHAIAAADPRQPALNILQTILTSGHASRLHRALVEEAKLAVAIGGGCRGLDANVFVIHATLPASGSVSALEQALDAQLSRVVKDGVSEQELRRAKNLVAAEFWRGASTSMARRGCWGNTR